MNSDKNITSIPVPNLYDEKYLEFVDNVLRESAESFEKEQKFSDKVLLSLYNIFGGVFERALELYEKGRITHIYPESATTKLNDKHYVRHLIQVKGISGTLYMIFPDINYCTCASFRSQVLENRVIFTCKHVLAAWLGSIDKEKLLYQQITEKQFQNILLYQVSYKQHVF